jgi:hypothetical protein
VVFPQDTNRSPLEYSLIRSINERFQAGIEYDYKEDQLHPVMVYRVIDATESSPAIMLGTSSAWPSGDVDGNAVMLTAASMVGEDMSLTFGAAYILENEDWRTPASISYRIREGLSASVMYDGDNLHPLMAIDRMGASFQLILLGGEDPAIAVSLFE